MLMLNSDRIAVSMYFNIHACIHNCTKDSDRWLPKKLLIDFLTNLFFLEFIDKKMLIRRNAIQALNSTKGCCNNVSMLDGPSAYVLISAFLLKSVSRLKCWQQVVKSSQIICELPFTLFQANYWWHPSITLTM